MHRQMRLLKISGRDTPYPIAEDAGHSIAIADTPVGQADEVWQIIVAQHTWEDVALHVVLDGVLQIGAPCSEGACQGGA